MAILVTIATGKSKINARILHLGYSCNKPVKERSGSVVECLTRDREAGGSSLTGVTALWSLSKAHLS